MRTLLIALLLCTFGLGSALASSTGIPTQFSYQGTLVLAGKSVSGSYDLQFRAFRTPDESSPVGIMSSASAVPVKKGAFTTTVDFGPGVFNGEAVYIQVSARKVKSTSPFVPSQAFLQVLGVPYAMASGSADAADIATTATYALQAGHAADADTVGGLTPASLMASNWINSTTDFTAQAGAKYLVNSDTTINVTLPSAPALGDTFRLSAGGKGGWQITQNAGQKIATSALDIQVPQAVWPETGPTSGWDSIYCSADGSRVLAAGFGTKLNLSTNGGLNYVEQGAYLYWTSVAGSADGTVLYAVADPAVYRSTDGGATFTPVTPVPGALRIACSSDGTRVAACTGTQIFTSPDSGVTWTPRLTASSWQSIAISADGNTIAAGQFSDTTYTSKDFGQTWTAHSQWSGCMSMAVSADGQTIVGGPSIGRLRLSVDGGNSFTLAGPFGTYYGVSVSADGSRIAAAHLQTAIYTSTDRGTTWHTTQAGRPWYSIAGTSDHRRLFAGMFGGKLARSTASPLGTTTEGAAGYLSGGHASSLELQYIGNNTFLPLSPSGAFGGK